MFFRRLCFLEKGVRAFFFQNEKLFVAFLKNFSIIYICVANFGPSCLCFMEMSNFFNDENASGSFVIMCWNITKKV